MLVLAADHLIADQPAFAAAVAASDRNWPSKASWSPSASSPKRPKPAMATSKPKATRSFVLSKNRLLKKPRNIWPVRPLPVELRHVLLRRRRHAARDGAALPGHPGCYSSLAWNNPARPNGQRLYPDRARPADSFAQVPDDSIDYAVMEKSAQRGRRALQHRLERHRLLECARRPDRAGQQRQSHRRRSACCTM